MPKLDYLQQKKLNPADELREILFKLEQRQPGLKSLNPTQALMLLRDLDHAYALLTQLEASSVNLQSERGRFEAFQSYLRKQVGPVLKALGGAAALAEYRPKPAPPRERWWWYIHENVAANQKQLLRRVMTVVLAVALVLGAVALAFNTILAPSPEAVARMEAENVSLEAFETGNYQDGLAAIEKGLSVATGDPGLLIIKGVLHETLDQPEQAAASFEQARAMLNDPSGFYLGRGQIYYRTGQFVKAENDARTSLEANDQVAMTWLLLGQALEMQNRKFEAIPAYEQAGELALANGDNQVVVLARLALGRVTSSVPMAQ